MAYRPHITDAQQVFSDEEILGLMPKSFLFVAQLIGIEAALHLIHAYGGTTIFIPSQYGMNINHEVTQVIGLKSLKLLSAQLGNTTIEVPMGTPITVGMRNRMIRKLAKKESKAKLARKFDVTLRTIRSVVNGKEKLKMNEDRNLDLFSQNS
ncbi:Mor transcription activator family protein [Acinetobacter sp. V102_4]|uniref:Mor transcription activator family protein n=1 Tax=Acinetobacter sp. V102_4 TaxID=3072984 RepID=UPI00287D8D25|nr:Mor transcription activator family protein [Acinetobacter sp. V102_4]MDS7929589.1 Mor transcription activator family protein [Acinetobacter sp. V102_4]